MIKTFKHLLLLVLLVLILPGCLDIYFTTEIKTNGDIVKTVVLEGDSTEIIGSYLPIISNESWEREWIWIDKDKSKLVLKKTFKNDRLASKDLNPSDSLPRFRIEPELDRKFRWFFTYFEYKDIVLANNPFNKLDWRDYLSEAEVNHIAMDEEEREDDPNFNEESYKETEKRFEEFLLNSAFEELFQLFALATDKTSGINITRADILAQKDSIFKAAVEADNNDSVDEIMEVFGEILGSDDVLKIVSENRNILDYFDLKLAFFEDAFDDNLFFTIRMPGLLINTNSNKIEGNELAWEMDPFDAYFKDFPMTAESRIVNKWAFVLTGIALAFLLVYMIWGLFKKKRS